MNASLPPVPLSALDVAPVVRGSTPAAALTATRDLARHVEQLGFTRFWLAEHHNMPGIASSSPAVLIAAVGAVTERIRVGSGGVMLPNHPPLVVAEQFGTLEALYPGRVDLGIGRAPGTDQRTAMALRRRAEALGADEFPEQLGELLAFFSGEFPAGHPYRDMRAVPGGGGPTPPVWLLGSSGYSAQVAGLLGLPFAFAHHFSAANTVPALELYRSRFEPSAVLGEPYALVAVQVVCAPDDEEAAWLAAPSALSFIRLRSGHPGRLPTPEEAAAHPWTPDERAWAAERHAAQAVGGPETVAARLGELLKETQADELMLTTMVADPAAARASMTRAAKLFGPGPLPAGLDGSGPLQRVDAGFRPDREPRR
jgi:luciferase family oxidoreductase group 1